MRCHPLRWFVAPGRDRPRSQRPRPASSSASTCTARAIPRPPCAGSDKPIGCSPTTRRTVAKLGFSPTRCGSVRPLALRATGPMRATGWATPARSVPKTTMSALTSSSRGPTAHMFELEPRYRELQDEARALADAMEPFAVEADAMSTVHAGMREALASSKLWELVVPGSHGGRFDDVDPLAVAVVREVLMATSSHLDSLFALQGIGSYAITSGGTNEQRDTWLPRVLTGEALAALGLTEPEAGSDLKSVRTELISSG